MAYELILLRFVHIVAAALWVGGASFNAFILLPSLTPGTPTYGEVMQGLARRRAFDYLGVLAVLTMLSGARLMMLAARSMPGFFSTWMGTTYGVAGLAALLAFLIGMFFARPAMMRGDAKLGGRFMKVALSLLLFATAGMAVARYL